MRPDLRFPKSRRLTRSAEYERIRKDGRRARGALLSLSVLSTGDGEKVRAGCITSRKIGGAAVRNRVRRRLREIVRRHQNQINEGIWVVTIASPAAARAGYDALEAEWLRLARRTSILAP